MAGGMDLGGSGKGKRSLDAALNLVPFIDLMAVTIVFLIMSAVWTQLGRLQVAQGGAHGEPVPDVPTQPPVTLLLSASGLKVSVAGVETASFPAARDERGRLSLEALGKKLDELKGQLPDQPAVTIDTEDGIAYDDLVRVIDTCVASRFPSITVQPIGGF